jgi:hypothetical protein
MRMPARLSAVSAEISRLSPASGSRLFRARRMLLASTLASLGIILAAAAVMSALS